MSQHDLDIANQGFPATRADLNLALKALGSSNSGATAPSTTYANQLWYDTANNILKIRNEDNDAFISLFTLDQTADNIEALTINGTLTVAGNLSVDGGTIKLDGNYPTGTTNTALGDTALDSVQSGGGLNVAIGQSSLTGVTTGDNNTGVGAYSGITVSTSSDNSYFGAFSGYHQTGATNTALGYAAMNGASGQSSGSANCAVGHSALTQITSGNNNVAVGKGALTTASTASNSTCVGQNAGQDVTTAVLTAVGQGAGKNITSGSGNTCIGQNAGQSVTTTTESVFIGGRSDGVGAGYATTGGSNTFIGSGAGSAVTSGTKNSILGRYDGNLGGLDIRTGSNNIVLSDGDGVPRMHINNGGYLFLTPNLTQYGSFIGNINVSSGGLTTGFGTNNGEFRNIYSSNSGGSIILKFHSGSNVASLSTGGAWTDASDASYKRDIEDLSYGISTVKALQPRLYHLVANENDDDPQIGFVAQEIETHVPEVVVSDEDKDGSIKKGVSYGRLTAVLTKALQEAIAKIETLETKVAALEAE